MSRTCTVVKYEYPFHPTGGYVKVVATLGYRHAASADQSARDGGLDSTSDRVRQLSALSVWVSDSTWDSFTLCAERVRGSFPEKEAAAAAEAGGMSVDGSDRGRYQDRSPARGTAAEKQAAAKTTTLAALLERAYVHFFAWQVR